MSGRFLLNTHNAAFAEFIEGSSFGFNVTSATLWSAARTWGSLTQRAPIPEIWGDQVKTALLLFLTAKRMVHGFALPGTLQGISLQYSNTHHN